MEITTTREQLYEEIWKEPISKVCKKYNVSDNALRKKCIALDIPMPDNAYWANYKLGKQVLKKPLPIHSENAKIVFQSVDNSSISQIYREEDFNYFNEEERKKIIKIYNNLDVKKRLDKPHDLIMEHMAFWVLCEKNKVDLVHIFKGIFDKIPYNSKLNRDTKIIDTYSVSKGQIHRAYLIYNCLFDTFEQCGFKVAVNSRSSTSVTIRGEQIDIRIREKYQKVELNDKSYSWTTYEYNPKGELVFMFKSSIDYNYCEVGDSKNEKLEKKIKTIFKKLCDKTEQVKIENNRREEVHRKYELERIKQEEIRKIHDKEKEKVQDLINKAQQFQLAEKIRKYASALKRETQEEIEKYEWIMQKADWFDPSVDKIDNILSERDKDELSLSDKSSSQNNWRW